jgi:hypothetical protein
LCFGNGDLVLEVYIDADMAGDVDSKKSTPGYVIAFAGELCHGNQSYRSVLLSQPL